MKSFSTEKAKIARSFPFLRAAPLDHQWHRGRPTVPADMVDPRIKPAILAVKSYKAPVCGCKLQQSFADAYRQSQVLHPAHKHSLCWPHRQRSGRRARTARLSEVLPGTSARVPCLHSVYPTLHYSAGRIVRRRFLQQPTTRCGKPARRKGWCLVAYAELLYTFLKM